MALGAQGLARNQGTGHVRAWLAPLMACLPLSRVTHAVIRPGVLAWFWPFALLLLVLLGESVNPVRRVNCTLSSLEGDTELSGTHCLPHKQGIGLTPVSFLPAGHVASLSTVRSGVLCSIGQHATCRAPCGHHEWPSLHAAWVRV